MARLIEADALKAKAHADPDSGEGFVWVQDIDEAPTVDAVPVVHGRWIEHPKAEKVNGKWISNYECSECCCFYRSHENYCGYCGSKMDLEVKDA